MGIFFACMASKKRQKSSPTPPVRSQARRLCNSTCWENGGAKFDDNESMEWTRRSKLRANFNPQIENVFATVDLARDNLNLSTLLAFCKIGAAIRKKIRSNSRCDELGSNLRTYVCVRNPSTTDFRILREIQLSSESL